LAFHASDRQGIDLFDEFLREHEFELALHVVCDLLLDVDAPPASRDMILRIEQLHERMEVVDDCATRLRLKCGLA
jgi:hypothetical protein